MKRHFPLLSLLALLTAPPVGALGLPELEQRLLEHDPRLEAARQDIRLAAARQTQREAENGWSLFASANAGRAEESAVDQSSHTYTAHGYQVGASYPLFGSRRRLQQQVDDARREVETATLSTEVIRLRALQELRQLVLELWQAERRAALADAFLAERAEATRVLALRRRDGLLLASDEQTFLSAFAEAEAQRDEADRLAGLARQRIARLTGLPVERLRELDAPALEAGPLPDAADDTAAPAVRLARQRWESRQQQARGDGGDGVQSSLDLSFSDGRESWASNIPNRSLLASVTVRIPLEIGKLRRGLRDEAQAELEKTRLGYDEARDRQALDTGQAQADARSAATALLVSAQELEAARLALRERTLRAQALPGDELEKRLQARYGYYRAALRQLDNWGRWQQAAVRLAALGAPLRPASRPAPDRLGAPLGESPAASPDAVVRRFAVPAGSYVWHSEAALRAPQAQIRQWQRYGLSRVLVGLDAAQVADPALTERMARLRQAAHARGMRVEIVLCDPDWITPAWRARLLALLRRLAPLPADGLNLDLEIEQLPDWESRRAALTADWLATLAAAARVAPWPLGATFHHRHLGMAGLGARLRAAGVDNAAVMIFSTDPARVVEVAAQARVALDGLPLALVQSVERQLPPSESYASRGIPPLIELSRQLQSQGRPALLLQSWDDLRTLPP